MTIGNSVTSIGYEAFRDCSNVDELIYAEGCTTTLRTFLTSIKRVTIPNSVTIIGGGAFEDCSDLTSVTIPNSLTIIGACAFRSCSGLTSVTIPNSVTSICYDAFFGCSGLTSVTIPNSVTSIESGAFRGCSGLKDVTVEWMEPLNVSGSIFYEYSFYNSIIYRSTLHVPTGTAEKYRRANVWKDFGNIVEY